MSLDVYLIQEEKIKKTSSGIFVRENGQTVEISVDEWNKRNPDMEPVKFAEGEYETNEVFSWNVTHNLGAMSEAAGIYKALWRPEELGITKAKQLIAPLRKGLHKLKMNPEKYKKYNPENGWGSYEGLVEFVEKYLNACYEYKNANIEVCR